jgi:2-hydroxymuconate-semialdehyde hydrolase
LEPSSRRAASPLDWQASLACARSRFVDVGGIRTHYLEAGDGDEVIVLLHAGGWGQSAALTWGPNIAALAEHFRVVAPDWLGFGQTDKLRDFASGSDRMLRHLVATLDVLAIGQAHFVGVSMGGTYLIREAARRPSRLGIRRMVVCSGGGFVPANDQRRDILAYDGTEPAMRKALQAAFHSPVWEDDAYVRARVETSLMPGAWETTAAARLTRPGAPPRSEFGNADATVYEDVDVPTLVIAGAHDQLREPGYHVELAERIPGAQAILVPDGGHMLNFDCADWFNRATLAFLNGVAVPAPSAPVHV